MIKTIQLHYNEGFERALQAAAQAGYTHVSVGFGDIIEELQKNKLSATVCDVKEKLKKHGLICVQTHLPYYSLVLSSDNVDEKTEEAIKGCILLSGEIGARWAVMHPRSGRDFDKKQSFEDNVRDINSYLPIAKQAGTILAVENLPVFPGWATGYHFSSDYKDLCELHDYFGGDKNLCVCWDFGHAHLTKFDHAEALKYVGSRIKCVHMHDNFGYEDDHNIPLVGNCDWHSVIPALMSSGYSGAFTLEARYCDNEGLAGYMRYSHECVSILEKIAEKSL